ncbi:MAG: EF-P lysine aminoacylase EpmA [Planctomycetaceae bacterium]
MSGGAAPDASGDDRSPGGPGSASSDFLPTASLRTLELRARALAATRRFLDARGYFEVDVPLVSADRVIDPHLAPFAVFPVDGTHPGRHRESGHRESGQSGWSPTHHLQTSVEFGMKRLLAAGARAIYQLSHVFRAEERGPRHNPEFTMLEWYRVGDTHVEQMAETEALVAELFTLLGNPLPFPFGRLTYQQAFERSLGIDPLRATVAELARVAAKQGVAVPESLDPHDRDGWLNLLLAFCVEPTLGVTRPEFVCDYPASQAALARLRPGEPPVAERFELYLRGVELCNGYHELTSADELRERIDAESDRRARDGLPPLPVHNRLLDSMESGLPPCAGTALGFDRVLMLAVGASRIDQVIPFPWDRA